MKMKNTIRHSSFILMSFLLILTYSCSKDDTNTNPIPTGNGSVPVLSTLAVSAITQTTASCGGNISSDSGSAVTARGVCWSTGQTPLITDNKTTDSIGIGSFTSKITGLTANTKYYVRAYATNSKGTGYGNILSFTTQSGGGQGTVTDIEGNVYHTVTIGTQVWMVENLKTTKYNDGTDIPLVENPASWASLTTAGYCWYNNDAVTYKAVYGALYNWYAVNTGKLCPAGWHVPTDAEWTTLTSFWAGNSSGVKLKETGSVHWKLWPNGASTVTNESGFTALPGGYCYKTGLFSFITENGYWWSSTPYNSLAGYSRRMYWNNNTVDRDGFEKNCGFSVRCIKD